MKQSSSLKIVHLTTSLKIGGAETVLVDLVDQLRKRKFEQKVICFYEGPHSERIRQLGVELFCVKGLVCTYDPLFFIRLFFILRKLRPDCIHSLLWSANFLGRFIAHVLGIPIVCAQHNNYDQNGRFRIWLDRLTVARSDKFIAVSPEVRESIVHYLPGVRCDSVRVITNGINVDKCIGVASQARIKRSDLNLSDKNFVIGSVGRFVSVKNYPELIDQLIPVVNRYPHVRVVLLGVGPQQELLKSKIRLNKLDKHVMMVIDQPALPYYALFDCFVLPSYKEGISMALLEALSFSLPCVVGNHLPQHSVIESGKSGLLVTPDGSFAQALISIIEQEHLRKLLSKQGNDRVRRYFSFNNMVNSYEDLFCGFSNRI